MFASKFGIRTFIAVTHDFVAVAVAWWLAYLFCFNFEVPSASLAIAQEILPWIVFVQAGIYLILMIISDWKQKYYSDRG
jgi:hypothetical protein